MKNLFKKAALATALAATTVASASPAMARDNYYHRDNGNTAGAAIAGGIIGLALGAIIASSSNDNDRRYRDDDRRVYRDGYYYNRDGYRYDRNGRRDDYARRGYRGDSYYRGY